jgi:cytoskeletal protein RodZ
MNTLDFEKDLVDKLAEIGSLLRQVREKKSISMEQVAATTRIRPRLLKAIEDGKLEHLPEPIYVQGFIRRFADTLGLNGTELANTFPIRQTTQATKSDWKELPAAPLRPIHLYLLYIILIIAAVSSLSYFINRSTVEGETPSISTVQPSTPAGKEVKGQPKALLQQARSPLQAKSIPFNKPVQVSVTLKAESWIQVKVDGKTEFEGILPSGTQRSWTADQQLVVRSGNAGGVLASFNDAPAKPLGEIGTIKTVTFEPKPSSASPLTPSAEQ